MLGLMDVFEAIADRNRRALLDLLTEGERSVGELVASVPLSQPAVSQHLKVLRELGLVAVRPKAQRRVYALEPQGLLEIDDWLERYRRYWADHLDSLEAHLRREAGAPGASSKPAKAAKSTEPQEEKGRRG